MHPINEFNFGDAMSGAKFLTLQLLTYENFFAKYGNPSVSLRLIAPEKFVERGEM